MSSSLSDQPSNPSCSSTACSTPPGLEDPVDRRFPTPGALRAQLPLPPAEAAWIRSCRQAAAQCLEGRNPRLLVVTGPCSIADLPSAIEYARRLRKLAQQVDDVLLLVMRIYLQKPRTTVGWKGFVLDPALDGSGMVADGLRLSRELLLALAELRVPAATEVLDPLVHEYLEDLFSWAAIGARTSESQLHREYASALECPVGFKNGVDGSFDPAINGVIAASRPQQFLGLDRECRPLVRRSAGNPHAHIILRGGHRPNYDCVSIAECERRLRAAGITTGIVVDCSHGNSGKDPQRQPLVLRDCISQVTGGTTVLRGVMLESNLHWGAQKIGDTPSALRPGLSVTDPCICWSTTERILLDAAERLRRATVRPPRAELQIAV